jgi:hypothetical protein
MECLGTIPNTSKQLFSHLTNFGQGSRLPYLHQPICNHLQRQNNPLENMDTVDIITPTGGDIMDTLPPYVGSGRCGRPTEISYTDEIAGPSPVPPTLTPPNGGFVYLHSIYGGGGSTRSSAGADRVQLGAVDFECLVQSE